MDKSARLRFLFTKYLQRQCSPDEMEELIILLQQGEADEALTEEMELLWEEARKDKTRHDVDWDKMYSSVISSEEQADVIINRATSRSRWLYYVVTAVSVFIIALPVYWFINRSASSKTTEALPVVTKVNTKTDVDRQTIHLPDGSTVILNVESKLNYPSAFSAGHRDVYLTGEGFFDIRHNPAQPFFVHTGKIVIKVLGSAFNIKAYPHADKIEVTVTRGKVQVLKENKVLGTLTASEQISFNNYSEDASTKIVDTLPVISWKPSEIFFNNITMEDAVRQIEERFKTKIEFANPAIKDCRVTATFSEDDMEEEILEVICAVSKADYKTVGDKIIISGKGCN